MAVYDGFIFFNELELLDIRLHELEQVVDKFVLVEATKTFSGKDKPLYFEENKSQFAPYLHKIIHVVIEDLPTQESSWKAEYFQRRAIARGFAQCDFNDIIIISDVDEIPRPSAIANYQPLDGPKVFDLLSCYYYINCVSELPIRSSRILTYGYFLRKGRDAQRIRWTVLPSIPNGGWHFSYLGGIEKIQHKIDSFAHQELNIPEYTNKEWLEQAISSQKDLFKRPIDWKIATLDSNWPKYIMENRDRFAHLIFNSG